MNHLYVCLFSNGHIKVGRSISPQARIASHEARVSCMGIELVDSRVFECVAGSAGPEAALIQKCRNNAAANHKSEWFDGLDFETVCQWAGDFSSDGSAADRAEGSQSALSKYLSRDGAQAHLAASLGKSTAQVWQWKERYSDRKPSPANCLAIERATEGAVTRQDLRPDDYWLIWSDLPAPVAKAEA